MKLKTDLRVDNKKSWKGSYRGFLGLISFSTILPLNIHTSIQEMAKFTWLWPIIGGFIGILVGLLGYVTMDLITIPQLVAAAIIYSFAIWFTGFHHLDGLVDFGDAVMAYLFIVGILTVASIASAPIGLIFFILLVSEVAAKLGLVTCSTFSKPYPNGTGKYFIEAMTPKILLLSLIITLIIGYLVLNTTGIIGIAGGLIGGIIMAVVSRMKFIYATGDILGASNEISRMIALVLMIGYLSMI